MVTSAVGASNRGSSRDWRNSLLWWSDTVAEFALAQVEPVVAGSALEGVDKPGYVVKKQRPGREGQG